MLRIVQEVDDFAHLTLGSLHAGDVVEGHGVGHACGLVELTGHTVDSRHEVGLLHRLLALSGCQERSLVADVCNVGTRQTCRHSCQFVKVNATIAFHLLQMHLEDADAVLERWVAHVYLSVETPGAQQCLVEHVGTVGGSQHDDAAVVAETVHFGEQLVERVFALIVA